MTKPGGPGKTDISQEEAENFARRMITSVEEVDSSFSEDEWSEFVGTKILGERGYEASDRQMDALSMGRGGVFGLIEDVGVHREQPFVTRPGQIRYRDVITGRWTSATDINAAIYQLKKGGQR